MLCENNSILTEATGLVYELRALKAKIIGAVAMVIFSFTKMAMIGNSLCIIIMETTVKY